MVCGSFKVIILCGFILGNVCADPIDYSDCGSDYKIIEVDIDGCASIPCKVQIGNSYNITISLQPSYTSHSLSQQVYITLYNSVDVPVNVLPVNPCASLACPVTEGFATKFKATLYIGDSLMPVKGKLWWKMTTDGSRSAVCMKTTVTIVARKYKFKFLKSSIVPAI